YLLYSYRPYPYRHSFPTRRSSDLCGRLWQTESICQQMRFPKEYRIASRELPHSAILNSIKLKRCGCLYGISRASYAVPNMKNHGCICHVDAAMRLMHWQPKATWF